MDEPVTTTVNETKPKRSRRARTTKSGEPKARTTKAGTKAAADPKIQAGPPPAEHVPVAGPEMPQRQPARPSKVVPAAKPVPEADAKPAAAPPTLTRSQALQILVDRANQGSQSALDCLRQLLDRCPEIWTHVGDLTRHAEIAWTGLVAGDDHLLLESVKRYVERLKSELAGPTPSPVERLLAEQAALTWLASRHAEIVAAAPGTSSLGEAKVRFKRAESAQRRHMASLKTLTELRVYCSRTK